MPLDVPTAIAQRRSIKTFKPNAIAPDLLKQLVELTVAAPSSYNIQGWRIILVQDAAQKAALAEAAWGQAQIVQAPVTFVFATDVSVGTGDLTPVYEQGLATGAWSEATVSYFKTAIPQFYANVGDKAREYGIKDALIAATHLMLAAESLGLSTCPLNGWVEEKVKAVVGLEDKPEVAIALLVTVGYASEPRKNPGRLPLSYNVFQDKFGIPYVG
ncbi:MAG: nitroreductase [Leptolyngbyaceae cyanobacterium CSU_1_4]|nr:nitroreductase [Leptolyngbyaceae cyanobacterium CSU_1_4]